jgi:hypothetical protein
MTGVSRGADRWKERIDKESNRFLRVGQIIREDVKQAIRGSLELMLDHGVDERLFAIPVTATTEAFLDQRSSTLAVYDFSDNTIIVNREAQPGKHGKPVFEGMPHTNKYIPWVILHEIGHHLSIHLTPQNTVLPERREVIPSDVSKANRALVANAESRIKAKELSRAYLGALQEYNQLKRGVERTANYGKERFGVSGYAETHNLEWFAESFAYYFTSPRKREWMKTNTPDTYRYIRGMVTGEFFERVRT